MTVTPPEAFLPAVISGAAALALWDVLHGLRCSFVRGSIGNFVLDTAWWVVSVSLFLSSVWSVAEWRLRFFELFAAGAGAALYHFTLSRMLRHVWERVFGIILKIIKFIFKILLTPARFLYKILIEPCIVRIKKRLGRGRRNETQG